MIKYFKKVLFGIIPVILILLVLFIGKDVQTTKADYGTLKPTEQPTTESFTKDPPTQASTQATTLAPTVKPSPVPTTKAPTPKQKSKNTKKIKKKSAKKSVKFKKVSKKVFKNRKKLRKYIKKYGFRNRNNGKTIRIKRNGTTGYIAVKGKTITFGTISELDSGEEATTMLKMKVSKSSKLQFVILNSGFLFKRKINCLTMKNYYYKYFDTDLSFGLELNKDLKMITKTSFKLWNTMLKKEGFNLKQLGFKKLF